LVRLETKRRTEILRGGNFSITTGRPALLSLKAMYEIGIKIAHPQFFRDGLYPPVFGQEEKILLFGKRQKQTIRKT
jgi:hypothetical protein